ncbi:hypothetical protein ISR92_00890 [Patescibacteria group bacterium]|nr:hypothetical protein [Patescibacteria group bacterium]
MDEKRKGEIAMLLLKDRLSERGLRLGNSFKREMGTAAKAIGIELEEMMEFAEILTRELLEETFPSSSK